MATDALDRNISFAKQKHAFEISIITSFVDIKLLSIHISFLHFTSSDELQFEELPFFN